MSTGGELLRWTLGRILPLALVASIMLGLLVAMSGTANWARRIAGVPQTGPEEPELPEERHVAVMMAMLRGFATIVACAWLVEGALAILAGVMVVAGTFGSGDTAKGLAEGAGGLAVGSLSVFVGRKLINWRPERPSV